MSKENKESRLERLLRLVQDYELSEKKEILGKVLTIAEAVIADQKQCKAVKDMIHNAFWGDSVRVSAFNYLDNLFGDYAQAEQVEFRTMKEKYADIPVQGANPFTIED